MINTTYIEDRGYKVGDRVQFLFNYEVGFWGQVAEGSYGTVHELVDMDSVEPYMWIQMDNFWPGYAAEDWAMEEWPVRGVQIMDYEMEPGSESLPIRKAS